MCGLSIIAAESANEGPSLNRRSTEVPPPRLAAAVDGAGVLFVNDLWGYGTVSIVLAIAAELEGRAVRRFAGRGPGFDLARRFPFEGWIETDTMAASPTEALERAVRGSDAVVSVMNPAAARVAAEAGVPCAYVDMLLWMWSEPPSLPAGTHYFQESFPGARERLEHWRDRLPSAELVGPIIARPPGPPAAPGDQALINFGGMSCVLLDDDDLVVYAQVMAECSARALTGWPGPVVVAAGRHVLDRLDVDPVRRWRPDVQLKDLGHLEYLREVASSRLLVTSAGMHALSEAFRAGVPCACLPAQNLSQVLALDVLGPAGVCPSLDWRQLYGLDGLDPADEPGACRRIAGTVRRFRQDDEARNRLVGHLRRFVDEDVRGCTAAAQGAFYAGLGEPGAPRIASHVLERIRAPQQVG
jgi:hypothetical protein